MGKRTYITKRIGAILLGLALVIGMLPVMGAFAVAEAQTETVEKFTADFGTLTAGEVSTDATNATTQYLKSKFHFWYAQETSILFQRPNVNDFWVDANGADIPAGSFTDNNNTTVYTPDTRTPVKLNGWADYVGTLGGAGNRGKSTWKISDDGMLYQDATYTALAAYRRYNQLTVLDANGTAASLKNFELTMDFKLRPSESGFETMTVAFRAATEATKTATDVGFTDRAIVAFSQNGYFIGGPEAENYAEHTDYDTVMGLTAMETALNTTSTYTLKLRVVGNNIETTVCNADGTVAFENTTTTTRTDEGYLVLGGSNAGAQFDNIVVTRLDDNGEAVDFTTEKFTADFRGLTAGEVSMDPTDTTNAYLTDKFHFYYEEEGGAFLRPNVNDYFEKLNENGEYEQITELGSVASGDVVYEPGTHKARTGAWNHYIAGIGASDKTVGISKWALTDVGMLYSDANYASEAAYFHRYNQMTVLDATGEAAVLKNFELKMNFKLRAEKYDSFIVSFRAATEVGCVANTGNKGTSVDRAVFTVHPTGWFAGGPTDTYSDESVTYATHFDRDTNVNVNAFASALNTTDTYTLKLRVVGSSIAATIYNGDTLVATVESETVWTDEGYLIIGGSNAGAYYSNIEVTRLDDNGTEVDFTDWKDNIVTVDNDGTITVVPAAGYELKAGSLLATDVNGDVYVPQRVGFRNDGNASQYEVPGGTAPYTVSYEFVQPTPEQPNIGNIGISYNTEMVGLRFISRFTRKVVDGTEYVVLNDKMYAIKDYGMLLASDVGLMTTVDPAYAQQVEKAMVVNSDNQYVQKISVVEANKYYDICDDHVDMAVTIINIDKLAQMGYDEPDLIQFYARPYVVIDVDGVETPLYGVYFNSNNKDIAKQEERTTSTISELNTESAVLLNGRNTLNDDGSMSTWFGNTGFTLTGEIAGDVDMAVTYTPPTDKMNGRSVCRLNITVDGVQQEDVILNAGESCVKLADNLINGQHTITVSKGMGTPSFGTLQYQSVTYVGTLELPERSDLQFEFLGDSITDSAGIYLSAAGTNASTDGWAYVQTPTENVRLGYAALTSKALGADFTLVSNSGNTIAQTTALLNNTAYGTDAVTDKDVVVINLGTNDTWRIGHSSYPNVTNKTVAADVKTCLDTVRAKYPNATIVWVYGMMSVTAEYVISEAVAAWVTETGDTKTSYYSLSAAQNQAGDSGHPDVEGHEDAAKLLTAYLAQEVDISNPEVEKTYATYRQLKIACVGDSITAGGYWNNNLQGELSTANYTVNGFGVSGSTALFKGVDWASSTSNVGKAYVDQTKYADSLAYGADAVVIMLGTNDSKDVNWPDYGDEFIYDYISIVRSYQNSSTNPMVFIALPPTVYNPDGGYQNINNTVIEDEIIPALNKVAAVTGAVVIDTHTPTADAQNLTSDGVHPNDAGKLILCETIAAAVIKSTGIE